MGAGDGGDGGADGSGAGDRDRQQVSGLRAGAGAAEPLLLGPHRGAVATGLGASAGRWAGPGQGRAQLGPEKGERVDDGLLVVGGGAELEAEPAIVVGLREGGDEAEIVDLARAG